MLIKFDKVTKTYLSGTRPALADVSLVVDDGEFVFLVGASGSGKSTLLRLVLRAERPTGGTIMVDGINVGRLRDRKVPKLRRGIGTVFQDFQLLPDRSVYGNVEYAMEVLGRRRRDIRKTVPNVLEMVGLAGKEERRPNQLSGGEQQRVAIARALVNRPSLLIADEPTGNLDPDTTVGIMKLLDDINRNGTTVVMATHDAGIVDSMRKRVVELSDGRVVRDQVRGIYGLGG